MSPEERKKSLRSWKKKIEYKTNCSVNLTIHGSRPASPTHSNSKTSVFTSVIPLIYLTYLPRRPAGEVLHDDPVVCPLSRGTATGTVTATVASAVISTVTAAATVTKTAATTTTAITPKVPDNEETEFE
jgi:hypothetical protein